MAEGAISASRMASAAASANSSADVRSCLPNFVTPTPITATRRIKGPPELIPSYPEVSRVKIRRMGVGGLVVLGCGWIAQRHAAAARRLRIPLIFASRDVDRARGYAKTFGGLAAHGSYAEALADPRAAGAIICTPHGRHLADARAAFAAGKHVLL